MIAFIAIIHQGCSKSQKLTTTNDDEQPKEDAEIEFVVAYDSNEPELSISYYNIAYKINGQYIAFDNDANYQDICALTYFYRRSINGLQFLYNDFGFSKQTEWMKSPEYASLMEGMCRMVNMYLSGDKSKIEDKRILKMLDKYWYDFHPDRMQFRLDEEEYNQKRYEDYNSSRKKVYFQNNERHNFKDLHGNDLPEDALIGFGA